MASGFYRFNCKASLNRFRSASTTLAIASRPLSTWLALLTNFTALARWFSIAVSCAWSSSSESVSGSLEDSRKGKALTWPRRWRWRAFNVANDANVRRRCLRMNLTRSSCRLTPPAALLRSLRSLARFLEQHRKQLSQLGLGKRACREEMTPSSSLSFC